VIVVLPQELAHKLVGKNVGKWQKTGFFRKMKNPQPQYLQGLADFRGAP